MATTATVATTGLVTAGVAAASAAPPRAVADKRAATQANAPVEHRPAPEAAPRAANPVDWSGWWDPAVASAMPAFNPAPANGASSAANAFGSAANAFGSAANGFGSATNGFGSATNGFGSATNGFDPTANGLGPTPNGSTCCNGLGRPPRQRLQPECRRARGRGRRARARHRGHRPGSDAYGLVANGSGQATLGTGPNGPAGGAGPTAADSGPAANGSGPAPFDAGLTGDANSPTTLGAGRAAITDGPVGNGSAAPTGSRDGIDPVGAEGLSTPTYRASTSPTWAGGPLPASSKPSPTPRPLIVDAPPVPTGAVPNPRTSGPVDPVSGLRRRIPQAHLSAELRTPEAEPAEPVVDRRSTVDAAAALSRYQASRAAAQAAVGDNRPGDTTSDSDNTTDDAVNGGRA